MNTIVIVDDEHLHREALKKTIPWADLGCRVIGEAENGQQGLELVLDVKPDIVIVDINMPIRDGLSMVKELKEMGSEALFIMLTGFAEFDYARSAIKYGVDSFCLKPIDDHELISELSRLISKKNQLNQKYLSPKNGKEVGKHISVETSEFMNAALSNPKQKNENEFANYFQKKRIKIKEYRLLICIKSNKFKDVSAKTKTNEFFSSVLSGGLSWDVEYMSWLSESNRINILLSSDNENNMWTD